MYSKSANIISNVDPHLLSQNKEERVQSRGDLHQQELQIPC